MSERVTILTVEDDPAIRRGIVDALKFSGYDVCETADGDEGIRIACDRRIDLILLDWVLPRHSGMEVLAAVRQAAPTLPVIMLTARGREQDRVEGLKAGADDYVVKPFSVQELLARIEAVLRRSPHRRSTEDRVELARGIVDLARREFRGASGTVASLSEKEIEVFRYLWQHADRVVGRDELLQFVWKLDPKGLSTRTIDMHVARLREKLGDDPADPTTIVTVRGKGYKLAGSTVDRPLPTSGS